MHASKRLSIIGRPSLPLVMSDFMHLMALGLSPAILLPPYTRPSTESPIRRLLARTPSTYLAVQFACQLVILVAGCGPPAGDGPGHRAQTLALSAQQELDIGRQASQEILQTVRADTDFAAVQQVREISERIARAVQIEPLEREINLRVANVPFEWEYHVLNVDRMNAFCLPGGKVFVFRGLRNVVQNDDQLAAVIAHEVAHALAHHVSERIAHRERSGDGLFSLRFDREQESEADHIGVFLMTFAGYDPQQAIAFWEEMQAIGERSIQLPEILSDHPNDAHRLAKLKEWVPMAKAAKQAYDSGRILPKTRE
jgi:metalloendopeptidase OMA1, mitochondrial